MKFIWNEPEKHPEGHFPKIHWDAAVYGWLNFMGVWPDRNREHYRLEYNYAHHFFDITIFECWLPDHGNDPASEIKAMYAYLQGTTLDWLAADTYTWDEGKQRPGVRFWIQAEDHPLKHKLQAPHKVPTLIERLRKMSEDKALPIGEAWNMLDEVADKIEELERCIPIIIMEKLNE